MTKSRTRVTMRFFLIAFSVILASQGCEAWFNSQPKKTSVQQPKSPPPPPPEEQQNQIPEIPESIEETLDELNPITPGIWNSMTSAAISFASKLAPKELKERGDRAARVQVNQLPPTSFKVDLTDVPLVGKALTGTYAKVKDESKVKKPSVVIASPKDKFGAISDAVDQGNLDFSLSGILNSGLDIQLEPNRPGIAPVKLQSPLIPKWPFANRRSDWYKVSNCGNGETYFFNKKTGETQINEPKNT